MDKLLEDYKQFQLNRRKSKTNAADQILVEFRYNNIAVMAIFRKFPDYSNEIFLMPTEIDDEERIIRLNESSVIGGYNTVNYNKIIINHRTKGNLTIIFPDTNLRDTAITLLQQIFSDESSDSGASV
ncbi:hypothetical protein QE152_g12529 [Popillia japonica]|uniref:Uncharacterized protein n=1 Tax=Popillia japonica TaxID=7064 RepID=A0AAW1LQZ0_POPJA